VGNGADLLRMLEPAIRPTHAPAAGSTSQAPKLPIENRSFESLLEEARQMNLTAEGGATGPESAATAATDAPRSPAPAAPKTSDLLAPLRQVDRIENSSLRAVINGKTTIDS
jgi:hypothetical protein